MLLIQVLQQHLPVPLPSFILAYISAPAPHSTRQSSRRTRLLGNLRNGVEVRPDCENNTSTPWQPGQTLPFASKEMVLNSFVLLCRSPPRLLAVGVSIFGPYATAPAKLVVHLYKVIVPKNWALWLDSSEKVHHSLLELRFEARHIAASVDFGEGHAEFIFQTPKARQQDRAGEKIILSVGLFKHNSKVVLDPSSSSSHGVFGKGPLHDIEGFTCDEIIHADGSLGVEGRVALRKVITAGGEETSAVSFHL